MSYSIKRIEGEVWRGHRIMDASYELAFHAKRPKEIEKPDFVLMALRNEKPCGFVTCIEMDGETLYWQLGGVFDEIKKTVATLDTLLSLITEVGQAGYKRITMRVENTNLPMLRLALKCGFLVTGTWNFKGKVFLELLNEFGGNDVI